MRQRGEILLIGCYELGHPPLSLASPLGFLSRAGFQPAALDLSVDALDRAAIRAARCIGLAVPMHTAMRLGLQAAERIRALNPDAHLCFYGLYAALNADFLLDGPADSVIGGEYEAALLALVERCERGGDEPVPGVSERGRRSDPALARLPFGLPEWRLLPPLDRYARLARGSERLLAGYVEASRGCKHRCLHCPITPVYDGRFFIVPTEVVLQDAAIQVGLGARHLTFGDPDFLNGPGHAMRIVRALHERHPRLTFDVTTKIEHILKHADLFPELAELGCAFVVSAVESFSDEVLERLRKGHTGADVGAALKVLRQAGIPMRPSLVAFTPWTTLADYREMLECVAQHRLIDHVDPVQYTIRLLVPPGSALLDQPDTARWLGPLDPRAFAYRWDHPDPRMDALHDEVSRLVEAATKAGEDPLDTYLSVRAAARRAEAGFAAGGRGASKDPEAETIREAALARRERVGRPPRLTESWFC